MDAVSDVMTKGDFAAAIGVSAGRVSQYIKAGQLYGPALHGEGRSARIVVSVAKNQLRHLLEPSQRFGANGSAVLTSSPGDLFQMPPKTDGPPAPSPPPKRPTVVDEQKDELAELRIRRERVNTEQAERKERLEIGLYMLTEEARREVARAVNTAFGVVDQGIGEIASELSEQFGVPQRDLQYALVRSLRGVRERAAEAFRSEADAEPEFVEDEERHSADP